MRRDALHQAVKDMQEKGAIEMVHRPDPGFYSQIFLVPKPGSEGPMVDFTAIAYLRDQGDTLSHQMSDLAVQVCIWAESNQMTLIPRHLPGHLNVLADQLSRKHQILGSEWSLLQAVADRVVEHWGKPMVDLFALKRNSKMVTYMSPVQEPETWKVDSLVQSWEGLCAYAYPPQASYGQPCQSKNRQGRGLF